MTTADLLLKVKEEQIMAAILTYRWAYTGEKYFADAANAAQHMAHLLQEKAKEHGTGNA